MTQEEMRRLIDELSKPIAEPFPSQMYAQPVLQSQGFEPGSYRLSRDDEYMAERSWIKKMFADAVIGSSQESDRHPRHVNFIRPRRNVECQGAPRRRMYEDMLSAWATGQVSQPKEPAELTAGDTSQLDDFLGGFAKREV